MNFNYACVFVVSVCLYLLQSEALAPCAPQQVHLSLTDTPGSMYVTWASNSRCQGKGVVKYCEANNCPASNIFKKIVNVDQYLHVDGSNTKKTRMGYTYRATMTNLKQNTTYNYVTGIFVGNSTIFWGNSFQFKTFPNDPNWKPSVLILADMGIDNAQAWPFIVEDALHSVDVIIHVGDFAYNLDWHIGHNGDKFMTMIEPVATRIPYMPVVGNHESHLNFSEYFNRFTTSGPHSLFYSINVGPFHIIALNSEFYFKIEYGFDQILSQYNWLKNDLQAANKNRDKQRWIITFCHRAMYTTSYAKIKGKEPERIRNGFDNFPGLEKIFIDNKVDISFWAHEHNYERFYPLNDYKYNISQDPHIYQNFSGIPHFIVGNAGARETLTHFDEAHPPWSAVRKRVYGYAKLTNLNSTSLHVSAYGIHESNYSKYLMDYVTITN